MRSNKANPLRVLVVEDSKDILLLMKLELEDMGYEVLTARDAAIALETAANAHPDIVVSDLRMPGMDGYELIRRIRSSPGISSIPAIVMTGFGTRDDSHEALEAGYNAYLVKPVDPQELSDLIQSLAGNQG